MTWGEGRNDMGVGVGMAGVGVREGDFGRSFNVASWIAAFAAMTGGWIPACAGMTGGWAAGMRGGGACPGDIRLLRCMGPRWSAVCARYGGRIERWYGGCQGVGVRVLRQAQDERGGGARE